MIILSFYLTGGLRQPIARIKANHVPQINSFVNLVTKFGWDSPSQSQYYKVQQVVNVFDEFNFIDETHVSVFLRRLHPGELGNLDEPTGYDYEVPIKTE